ncbi:MAG TPA: glycine cleavage system protein GcvH [Alphaproteobacteria bacterium]|jgi:glycine cleavage system H protein
MSETKYTQEHEWIRVEGDVGTVGITDYAQGQLGDVVYVELPAVGKAVKQGGDMAVVESVKAASEVYAPVSGEVVGVNDALTGAPETVNADAAGKGWFVKIKLGDRSQLDALMDEAAYKKFLSDLG